MQFPALATTLSIQREFGDSLDLIATRRIEFSTVLRSDLAIRADVDHREPTMPLQFLDHVPRHNRLAQSNLVGEQYSPRTALVTQSLDNSIDCLLLKFDEFESGHDRPFG